MMGNPSKVSRIRSFRFDERSQTVCARNSEPRSGGRNTMGLRGRKGRRIQGELQWLGKGE